MLLPASFRGVPFAVTESETAGGRRIALHQYPGRDKPWAEDMGRSARRFRFRGFVLDGDVKFAGLPVELQRATLVQAIEKKGSGVLTHPTLGVLKVCVERASISEALDASNRSDIELEFIEQLFPGKDKLSTAANSLLGKIQKVASIALKAAAVIEGVAAIASTLGLNPFRSAATAGARIWQQQIDRLAGDATALTRLVAQMPGEFGRFNAGGNAGVVGVNTSPYSDTTTVGELIPIASAGRVAVQTATAAFVAAVEIADLSDAQGVPPAILAMIDALSGACADPADAIRLMVSIIAWSLQSQAMSQAPALSVIIARAAAAALTDAVGQYQPASADDASARIATLGPVLESLALQAADAGEDESFAALLDCRASIVEDLRARGATLPQVRTFTFGAPLPALAIAQNIYGDPGRADQLVTQVAPPHPLFLPPQFQALAS